MKKKNVTFVKKHLNMSLLKNILKLEITVIIQRNIEVLHKAFVF